MLEVPADAEVEGVVCVEFVPLEVVAHFEFEGVVDCEEEVDAEEEGVTSCAYNSV